MTNDEEQIAEITATFYRAFSNRGGQAPLVAALYDLFLADSRIVKNVGGSPQSYDVQSFIEPRRAILSDGSMREFSEEETSAETDVVANIAQRISYYRKSWLSDDGAHQGRGVKSIQFVRTPDGWKIASLVWDDF